MLLHFPILEFHPFSMNKPRGKEMLAVKSCKGWVRKPQRSVCRSHLVTFNQLELPRWEGNLQDVWESGSPLSLWDGTGSCESGNCESFVFIWGGREEGIEKARMCLTEQQPKDTSVSEAHVKLESSMHWCWWRPRLWVADGMYKGDAGAAAESRQASQGQFRARLPLRAKQFHNVFFYQILYSSRSHRSM